jgi:hypothetical protein
MKPLVLIYGHNKNDEAMQTLPFSCPLAALCSIPE